MNELFTTQEYVKILRYEVLNTGELITSDVPLFMYYECINCEKKYKLVFQEVEARVRKSLAKKAARLKTLELRSKINPYKVDPDNGFESCGLCDGFDGKGNCFTDFTKQCYIRKLKNA